MSRICALVLTVVAISAGCNEIVAPRPESKAAPQLDVSSVPAFSVGFGLVCDLTSAGEVRCWGANPTLDGTHTAGVGTFTQVAVGNGFACGMRDDGQAECFADPSMPYMQGVFSGFLSDALTRASAGWAHACFIQAGGFFDGTAHCSGIDTFGEAPSVVLGPFKDVSAGYEYSCGVLTDGTINCWGADGGHGRAPASWTASSGMFDVVKAGMYHTCGLTDGGRIECMGRNDSGQADAHAGPYIDLAIGANSTCGLRSDGVMECWGASDEVSATRTARVGSFVSIDGRGDMICGYRDDGYFECLSKLGTNDPMARPDRTPLYASVQTSGRVKLSWQDLASNETRYLLERSPVDEFDKAIGVVTIAKLRAGATQFTDKTVTPGRYRYRLRACSLAGCGVASQLGYVLTVPPGPPAAPTDLHAENIGLDQIDLAWTDNAADETEFILQRRRYDYGLAPGWSEWKDLDTASANATSHSDSVSPGRMYVYRIRACNVLGCSSWANTPVLETPLNPDP